MEEDNLKFTYNVDTSELKGSVERVGEALKELGLSLKAYEKALETLGIKRRKWYEFWKR